MPKNPNKGGAAIKTTVPANCDVTFISDGGRIEEYSSVVHDHETYERRTIHTYHIIPDEGKVIDKVLFGGEDVTAQVNDGYFTTQPLTTDKVLEVIYKDAAAPVEPTSEPTSEPNKPDISKPDTSKPEPSVSPDTSTPQNTNNTDTAKTGDTTTAIIFVTSMITAISAAFIIVLAKRRKKKNGN